VQEVLAKALAQDMRRFGGAFGVSGHGVVAGRQGGGAG